MQGRRRPDTAMDRLPNDLEPGDYWKCLRPYDKLPMNISGNPSNLTGTMWMFSAPNGHGVGTLTLHTVREEEDGTASIRPGDGSSNSVLINSGEHTWHGYLEHGVWKEC